MSIYNLIIKKLDFTHGFFASLLHRLIYKVEKKAAKYILSVFFFYVITPIYAQDIVCEDCTEDIEEKKSGVDITHGYLTKRFDGIAVWVDNFFGSELEDQERARSFVRFRLENEFVEGGGDDSRLRIRGKLYLPKTRNRLNLFFSEETDQENNESLGETDTRDSEAGSSQFGLEFLTKENSRLSTGLRIGLRSGDELLLEARVKYDIVQNKKFLIKLYEQLYWQDTIGFGSKTTLHTDFPVSDKSLYRWSNQWHYYEPFKGGFWHSSFSHSYRFSPKHALTQYYALNAETDPSYLTLDHGPGFLFRVNTWKKWFFIELGARYVWERLELEEEREGVLKVIGRLEILFDENLKE